MNEEEDISPYVENSMALAENKFGGEAFNKGILGVAGVALLFELSVLTGMTHGTIADVATHVPQAAWQGYQQMLASHPIATKGMTSATVYTIGDYIAQRIEDDPEGLDAMRMVRSMVAGGIGHGPLSHFWYNFSEGYFTDVLHLTAWWSFIPKIAVDQAFFGPFWNNSYILLLGLMKLESPETIFADMKRTTIPLVLSGLKLWPFVHCITYGLIPVENRLLWVDAVEILWVTILATQAAAGEEGDVSTGTAVLES